MSMRVAVHLLAALALGLALPAAAQAPKPPVLQPVPEPPPPPPGYEPDPATEPQVTITTRGGDPVEAYRIGGRLYMVKVTPAAGRPYYMVDHRGDGNLVRHDSYDTGTRPPMWIIHTW